MEKHLEDILHKHKIESVFPKQLFISKSKVTELSKIRRYFRRVKESV